MWLRKATNLIGIPLIILFVVMAYFEVSPEQEPEVQGSGRSFQGIEADTGFVVSAANPEAVKAGVDILEQGGNAVDAAIAISFALSVVEPYGSGIGGGGSMLIYDPTDNDAEPVRYIDYRETAPLNLVTDSVSASLGGATNVDQLTEFGVPGFLKGMDYLYKQFGTMGLQQLLNPAITLADEGFKVDKYLAERFYYAQNRLNPADIPHYFPENTFIQQGNTLIQKELSTTLAEIAASEDMGTYFLEKFAPDMAQSFPILTEEDFRQYDVLVDHSPATGEFQDYQVYAAPAPLGGPVFIQALQMAELMNIEDNQPMKLATDAKVDSDKDFVDVEKQHQDDQNEVSEWERREQLKQVGSYVDFMEKIIGMNYETYRNRLTNIGDPQTSPQAAERELSLTSWEKTAELVRNWDEYVEEKASQRRFENGGDDDFLEEGTESSLPKTFVKNDEVSNIHGVYASATTGVLSDKRESFFDATSEINQYNNTTHFVIIDSDGRVVSATHTLSNFFGSGKYYKGFFLNDQLSNFSETEGSINEPYPGRRPRSFMSPAILMKEIDGDIDEIIGLGSPGGGRIPMMMAQVLIYYTMYDMDFDEAMTYMTRFQYDFNEQTEEYEIRLEPKFRELDRYDDIREELSKRGYRVTVEEGQMYFGGIQAVIYDAIRQELHGYADPRRGGSADGGSERGTAVPGTGVTGTGVPGTDVTGTRVPGTDVTGTNVTGTKIQIRQQQKGGHS
ncbi:hypothetical protein CR194_12750 [Salipaludibacillus keqinensis]|uniref:Gamma-glutamyltransferase n=1 Tax=Salipaludibacillus keqinensis TaxID=2045207 RepID=A0A323TIP7_9BACI|nr:gamma-glutamyltransferase [Salipaludibacillus keqinensis]PYZ92533.1 hypothetical protein CR194_12750 [Salipaludibacillus keqinensis]